jgi:predicted nucleic acid-binding protein
VGARRVLVDSGAWIALIRARDGRHADAEGMFQRAIRERVALMTSNLIIAEVHRFVLFQGGPRAAAFVLERIAASPRTEVVFATKAHHGRARWWLAKLADQRVSYTDAVSFALLEDRNCDAVMSFDADFTTAGFALRPDAR